VKRGLDARRCVDVESEKVAALGSDYVPDHQRAEMPLPQSVFGPLAFGRRLTISRFITPRVVADHRNAPVNALG